MSNLMNIALATSPDAVLQLRTRSVRSTDGSGSAVRVAVTERLAPHGHWVEVRLGEDPRASNVADVEAARLASTWTGRPPHGYPLWYRGPQPGEPEVWGVGDYDGPIWIDAFAEGEVWTPIPQPGKIEAIAGRLATEAGERAAAIQRDECARTGCTASRCADRAAEDAARDEYAFCLARDLEFVRARREGVIPCPE
jgi:hypothetical protein